MPLLKGSSKAVIDKNYHEFRHGPTFKHTERKFGKNRAEKQMSAVVLSTAGKRKSVRKHAQKKAQKVMS